MILDNEDVIAASSYGVHRLTKNSDRWYWINEGLTRDPLVRTLAIDSSGYLYAGVWYNSVFRALNPIITSSFQNEQNLTSAIVIEQNFPNPFVDYIEITFLLKKDGNINLTIYNILGEKVITLIHEYKQTGRYRINWKGQNLNGINVLPGTYFYTITNNQESISKKFIRSK